MNDKELIEKILLDNDDAFSLLIKKYQRLVYNTCYRILKNHSDTEDLCQDVFLEVHRSLVHLRNSEDMSGWLFKISYSKCISFIRKKNPAKASSNDDFNDSIHHLEQNHIHSINENPENILEKKEASVELFKVIDQLPENQKKVILLHKFEGHSQKEICKLMDLSQAAVESLIYRAKTSLRKSLITYFENS
ncbi:MAG: RNA polymerase sigma factor [Bacteroidales bacterium]|nr:RNA polymerase sigma factor [Bacteroidales bacterium]MCF8390825.1 RNA polymerase sigma factor [Bacteroidales bacterium]